MLQIENISKKYVTGDLVQQALKNVSLTLRDNEFVAILGPSGSGKTTLLNVIGGLDRYDSGDLIINGISTQKYKGADSDTGFEIGFKPGISFNLTDNFSLVAHYGFLGYRTKYNGSSVSGLSLSGNEISLSLYYCF